LVLQEELFVQQEAGIAKVLDSYGQGAGVLSLTRRVYVVENYLVEAVRACSVRVCCHTL